MARSGQSIRSLAYVVCFAAVGGLLGYANYYASSSLEHGSGLLEILVVIVAVPSVTSVVALLPWGFKLGDSYWRAPLLCAICLPSWFILHGYLSNLFSMNETHGSYWDAFDLGIRGAVDVFAMFAFIVRAMIVRSGGVAAVGFILFGAATNLVYLSSVGSTWLGPVCQYSLLMGVVASSALSLPSRLTPPQIQTRIVEAR